jgi:hypothetical protein
MTLAEQLQTSPIVDQEVRALSFTLSAPETNTGARALQGHQIQLMFQASELIGAKIFAEGKTPVELHITERSEKTASMVLQDRDGRVRAILRISPEKDAEIAINHPMNVYRLAALK